MTLDVLPGSFAVCRLSSDAPLPPWASAAVFSSVTRTPHELSILCDGDAVPADVKAQREFRGLMVRGPLDFSLTGILAALAGALAAAAISIFPVSTYDTTTYSCELRTSIARSPRFAPPGTPSSAPEREHRCRRFCFERTPDRGEEGVGDHAVAARVWMQPIVAEQ
jgi:hypothetical protein